MTAPKKEHLVKDDGRYIILYDFEPDEDKRGGGDETPESGSGPR